MIISKLAKQRNYDFDCDNSELNRWLKTQATQDSKRGYASVFVASFETASETIIGYYALSTASIQLYLLPEETIKKFPWYPAVPAIRIDRLAVDKKSQGKNLGRLLLLDALKRSCMNEIAWAIFLVNTKDEKARTFYEKFYFMPFRDTILNMWLKRKQVEVIVSLL